MFYLVYAFFKLMWFMVLMAVWMLVAMVVLPIALIMAATSNRRAARDFMRILNWGRMF
jgi:hypothetical protein